MNTLIIFSLIAYSVFLSTILIGNLIDQAFHKQIVRLFWRVRNMVSGRKPRDTWVIGPEVSLFPEDATKPIRHIARNTQSTEQIVAVEPSYTFEFTGQKACKRVVTKAEYEAKLLLAAKWAVSSHNAFIVHHSDGMAEEWPVWKAKLMIQAPADPRSFEEIVADKFNAMGITPHKYTLSHDLCRRCMIAMSTEFGFQTPMSYVLEAWVYLDIDECPSNLVKTRAWLRNHVAWKPSGSIRLNNGGHFTRRHAHAL